MTALDRLIKYVQIHTTSDPEGAQVPTTERQFDLARLLVEELKELGIGDAYVDDHCYVYAHIAPSPSCAGAKGLGLIAHLDTAPDFNGENVRPRIIQNYDGGDLELGHGRCLKVSDFPHLPGLKGRTLVTTDGSSLLGADDKAGVAEIMTVAQRLMAGEIEHGPISICFTPDEEVGRGPSYFDLKAFNADFAYTLDGGPEGEIVYENFNAASATVHIKGFNVHPGGAKNLMINALLVATEINSMLPSGETPRDTQGYEGFYHLTRLEGDTEKARIDYIIRDHDRGCFQARKSTLEHICSLINEKYGQGTAELTIADQYQNMKEVIAHNMHLVDNGKRAITSLGLTPHTEPIRGGTDGATLSFMGLPCPNLGTGGYAFHGPYEHITAEGMNLSVEVVMEIIKLYAKEG